ncbi:MAG: MBL fold metallo-hydrolase [Candidatus Nanopelagicaceae bacterium]|nr:MBL fold metallo-hydrolase [Candidatus Nanopelagicaceae bacterium]
MGRVTITFLGATSTVTGSRFLVTSEKSKILVDAGLFQGLKEVRKRNWDPFPVDPSTIDAIVLSHAHLDHCGYLPLLVRQGFQKEIFATEYTIKLSAVILRDSAHLQMEDAEFASKKGFSKHAIPLPLYNTNDVEKTLNRFSTVEFRVKTQITQDASVTYFPSGHILGSAFILLEIDGKALLFTSDMGRENHPLMASPDRPPQIALDAVITESTYGDRVHETPIRSFAEEINAAIKRGGSILIPAFAVDRTEVILMALRELIAKGLIPNIPIYVDSPMALTALDYYREAVRKNAPELRVGVAERWKSEDPFNPGDLNQMRTTEQSKSLNKLAETSLIISASGMGTGGRVVHHMKNMLPDPKNTVILVGFQAAGSRGRSLEEGKREIKIHGKWVPVHAHIVKVESFSVHADSDELISWLRNISHPKETFVVHGEPDAERVLAARLRDELGWKATIPKSGVIYTVG